MLNFPLANRNGPIDFFFFFFLGEAQVEGGFCNNKVN